MVQSLKAVAAMSAIVFAIGGCGLNPFGPGQGGLSIFAKIGKAMQKPSAISDKKNEESTAKAVVAAQSTAKRLAKGLASAAAEPWRLSFGLENLGGFTYKYWEYVANKPSDDDPDKLTTGRGEVVFTYSEALDSISHIDETKIIGIDSFYFIGHEYKTWNAEKDSIRLTVRFSSTSITAIKPGLTTAWGMNISESVEQGKGDTAYFALDSLDDAQHIQYGEGHFLDAHTGRDNSGESYAFDFGIQIIHKNTHDPLPNNPYLHYEDNEGIVTFGVPWGKNSTDSLHFTIHFFPAYERTGTIKDDNGRVRVMFTHNEKTGVGTAVYYDENGNEVGSE